MVQTPETVMNAKIRMLAGCLVSAAVAWKFTLELDGTEFSGGSLTGPLLDMQNAGFLLFLLAAILTFFFRRVAAGITLLAGLLCLPLYLLFTAPGPFRSIVGGQWKTSLSAQFVWDWWSIVGIVALSFAASA